MKTTFFLLIFITSLVSGYQLITTYSAPGCNDANWIRTDGYPGSCTPSDCINGPSSSSKNYCSNALPSILPGTYGLNIYSSDYCAGGVIKYSLLTSCQIDTNSSSAYEFVCSSSDYQHVTKYIYGTASCSGIRTDTVIFPTGDCLTGNIYSCFVLGPNDNSSSNTGPGTNTGIKNLTHLLMMLYTYLLF